MLECKNTKYEIIHDGRPPITVLKSWLSINTAVGCYRGCVYCNKDFYNIGDKKESLLTPSELVKNLESDWRFYRDKTPLSVNSRGIDPFNVHVAEETIEVLDILSKKGLKNVVGLITRGPISENNMAALSRLSRSLNLVVLFTYSGLPKSYEPTSHSWEKNTNTLNRLSDSGIKTIFYLRPIIAGVNDKEDVLIRLFRLAEKYSDAIVRESLRPNFTITPKIEALGVKVPDEQVNDAAIGRKSLTQKTRETIDRVYIQQGVRVPMFKKTSCAVSYLFGEPDYNAHWSKAETCCSQFCPASQMSRCAARKGADISVTRLQEIVGKKHFEICARKVDSSEYFDYERRVFLKHVTKLPIHEIGEECAVGYDVVL